jgi:hypothetical protein
MFVDKLLCMLLKSKGKLYTGVTYPAAGDNLPGRQAPSTPVATRSTTKPWDRVTRHRP